MDRVAVVDLGTNSFILLIGSKDGRILLEEIVNVGLGDEKVDLKCRLERARRTLEYMVKKSVELGAGKIRAFGTEFFRKNPGIFEELMKNSSVEGRILTSNEEAFYSHKSVLDLLEDRTLIVDIGGGSVEFIFSRKRMVEKVESFPIGLWYLRNEFTDESGRIDRDDLKNFLEKFLRSVEGEFDRMVGIGGTFTTMVAMRKELKKWNFEEIDGSSLDLGWIRWMEGRIFNLEDEEFSKLTPLAKGREKITPVSFTLVREIMERFSLGEVVVSAKGCRYGFLYSLMEGENEDFEW